MGFSGAFRASLYEEHDGRCHYCPDPAASLDHVVPRSVGGPGLRRNLVPACVPCNGAKGSLRGVCPCDGCVAAEREFGGRGRSVPPGRRWARQAPVDPDAWRLKAHQKDERSRHAARAQG